VPSGIATSECGIGGFFGGSTTTVCGRRSLRTDLTCLDGLLASIFDGFFGGITGGLPTTCQTRVGGWPIGAGGLGGFSDSTQRKNARSAVSVQCPVCPKADTAEPFMSTRLIARSSVTGFVFNEPSMVGKWLGVLKEIAPALSRVGFMVNPETSPHYVNYFAVFTDAAPKFKIEPIRSFVGEANEIEDRIAALARQADSGLLVAPDTFTALNRDVIAAAAARHRVPAVYVFREAVLGGGLISYGAEQVDVIRRSASYIDRILRGERPAELPIQAPVKFELVINVKAAKALGLEVPPTLLARADEVIE